MSKPDQFDLMVLPASALAKPVAKTRGHAWKPGTGPKGATCAGCTHIVRKRLSRDYFKCGLMKADWTGGRSSDVGARDAACLRWEAKFMAGDPQ